MMKRTLGWTAGCILFAAALCPAQKPPLSADVSRGADGSVAVLITNHYPSPITEYIIVVERAASTGEGPQLKTTLYLDSLQNPWHDQTIAPGSARTVIVAGPQRGKVVWRVAPELKAAIFEDGSTFGAPGYVARVIAARKMFFHELGMAIALIQSAQSSHMGRSELIREAAQQQQTDMTGARGPEQMRAVSNPWATLRANLQRNPSLATGAVEADLVRMFTRLRQSLILAKPPVVPARATVNPRD